MSATLFNVASLYESAPPAAPVAVPLDGNVAMVRSISLPTSSRPTTRIGVWECTPGRWVRQVKQAEFCHFLSGRAIFTSDDGVSLSLSAGDVVHFPENSQGVWEILETTSKIFMVLDEKSAS